MARKAAKAGRQKVRPRRAAEATVVFEAVLPAESGASMFAEGAVLTPENIEEFKPAKGNGVRAANVLRSLGCNVRHIGTYSISAEGARSLWEKVFQTKVEERRQPWSEAHPELGEVSYCSSMPDTPFSIPEELATLVERAYPQRPPKFFESPLPPRVGYHHLRVPADVGMILRSPQVHRAGVTGKGVLVAMPDSGFYKHPFYDWHGYNYQATLSPDATFLEKDELGHGTAEAANIFANASDIDFIGVCTSLPTTPHLVVGRSACRVGVGPSLNRSWAQRSRPVVQAGRRAFPGDESVVD